MRFPAPGASNPPPQQNPSLLPPGAGAFAFDPSGPSTLPNNILNALFSCAASETSEKKIIDDYWAAFPAQKSEPPP